MTDVATPVQGTDDSRPVLRILESEPVRWALLRPARDHDDDLDLLVAAEDLDQVLDVLRREGFVEEPSHGRGSHRFLVGHDGHRFVEIDLVTTLDFGPLHAWRSDMAEACLARRDRSDGTPRLDPGDELWVTVLHLLADDGADPTEPHRVGRLSKLAATAGGSDQDPGWRHVLNALLPAATTPEVLFGALLEGDERELMRLMAAIRPAVRRRCLRAALSQNGSHHLVRTAWLRATEPARQWRGRRGLLVALLGPDGAGKSTVLDEVGRAWPWPNRQVYFGLWPDVRNATPLSSIVWPLRRPIRAIYRYGIGQLASARGALVLFDRYVYDAAAPPRGRFQVLKRLYFGVLLRCVPAPDLVLLLDAPGEVLYARKGEMDPATLDAYRASVFEHVRRLDDGSGRPRVVTVDVTQPPSKVFAEVTAAIWDLAADRLTHQGPGQKGRGGSR